MNDNSRSGGFILLVLVSLLLVVMMIPITNILIDPDTPEPLNTPIYELGNNTLNIIFDMDIDTELDGQNDLTLRNIFGDNLYSTGRTNLIENGNFSLNNTNGVSAVNATLTVNNDILEVDKDTLTTSYHGVGLTSGFSVNSGDVIKFYIKLNHKVNIDTVSNALIYYYDDSPTQFTIDTETADLTINQWYTNSYIYTVSTADTNHRPTWYFQDYNTTDYIIYYDDIMMYNLTALFISGNEPTLINFELLLDYYSTPIYDDIVFELMWDLGLTENQWDYYYSLYVYYSSL